MIDTSHAFKALSLAAAVLALSGCASLTSLDNDVSTYSQWPAGLKSGSYTFERLPSQQARPEQQQQLEGAARGAIEAAGFTTADPATADFSVQVGARVTPNDRSPFDDPYWWPGGFWHGGPGFYGRHGFGGGPWGGPFPRYDPYSYQREAAVLIRDRKTGQALYEAHAVNDTGAASFDGVLPAMFEAAMKDFPNPGINPRRVTVALPPAP